MKKVLTIAGSDCSGGAGIQADLKTFMAHGCYGMSVITALTAQNTTGVYGIENCSADFVKNQLSCVMTDIEPDAIKIGMVSSYEIVEAIVEVLSDYKADNIVLDPVMVATSGSRLINDKALDSLMEKLIPLASLITPNLQEAELISGLKIKSKDDMIAAAHKISKFYNGHILIKGGHLGRDADDLFYAQGDVIWFEGKKINNSNTHGTGCTLSSAIASNLALGYDISESVARSKKYIVGAIADGMDLGKGRGPLNHGYNIII